MPKRLAILGGSILIVATILVAVYYQQRNAVGQGYDIKCAQPSELPSAAASLTCKIYQGQNAEQSHSGLHWWNVLIAWPEGITAWLLLLTLAAIVWQAWETRKAADAALESAKAAVAQIKAMKDKDRARLSIAFPLDDLETFDTRFNNAELLELFMDVVKDGESFADNVRASGYATITKAAALEGVLLPSQGEPLQIPSVIRNAPPDKPIRVSLAPSGFGTFIGIPAEKMKSVREGQAFLQIIGEITYNDVFGDPHTTPFHYVWQALDESLREPGETTVGYWMNWSDKPT